MRNLGEILSERESIAQEMQVNFWGLQNNFNSFGVFKTISSALESSKQFPQTFPPLKSKTRAVFFGWLLVFAFLSNVLDENINFFKISICQINIYQMEILQIV